jgi:hypothetical protein
MPRLHQTRSAGVIIEKRSACDLSRGKEYADHIAAEGKREKLRGFNTVEFLPNRSLFQWFQPFQ